MSYKSCSRSPDKDGTCYQSISRKQEDFVASKSSNLEDLFSMKRLGDEAVRRFQRPFFFAATMQKFGVKPAVYSLAKLHLKATHCHLTAKVSHAGLLKHEPSL